MTLDLPIIGIAAVGAATASALALVPLTTIIPLRMQQAWQRELTETAGALTQPIRPDKYGVSFRWKVAISVLGGVVGLVASAAYGFTSAAAAVCVYLLGLVLLAAINLKHELLPDKIVLPFLWAGLLYAAVAGHGSEHIYGATVGYGVPWALLFIGKASTGREFVGYGDLKVLAMAGAWFGLSALPVIFAAFVVGVIFSLVGAAVFNRVGGLLPTGPAHLFASLAYVVGTRLF